MVASPLPMNGVDGKSLALPDGHIIGYAELGDPTGIPLLYFHGTPGSRLELNVPGIGSLLEQHGLRGLALDRPGMGLSTPRPKRKLVEWSIDVAGFADRLGIDRFGVLGLSGGGPYALACGASIPERILGLGVVAGLGPPLPSLRDRLGERHRRALTWARWFPPALKRTVREMGARLSGDTAAIAELVPDLAEVDREILAEASWANPLRTSWAEAFRQGPEGPWRDLVLGLRPWGFELAEVAVVVQLWFGTEDRVVPPSMGRYLSAALPRSEARLYHREGHFSLGARRMGEIIEQVAVGLRAASAAPDLAKAN